MKRIILIFLFLGLVGCETVPPYSGPSLPILAQGMSGVNHRVEAGQTLWRISKLYGVDIDDILRLNHISEDTAIEIGQLLIIPGRATVQDLAIKSNDDDFIWPLKGRVIAGFGSSYHNLVNKGINIQAAEGRDILATRDVCVVFSASFFTSFSLSSRPRSLFSCSKSSFIFSVCKLIVSFFVP